MHKIPKFQWGNTLNINQYTNFLDKGLGDSQKWYNAGIKNRFNLGDTTKSPLNTSYKFDPASLLKSKSTIATGNASLGTNWLSKNSKTIGGVGNALGAISSFLPNANDDPTTNAINTGYDAAADAIMAIPGYGTLVGGAMKAMSFGNKALAGLTGGATTIKNPTTTADKILSSNLFALTPTGLANSLTKTKVSGTDKDLAKSASAYGNINTTDDTEVGGISKAFSWLTGSKNIAKQKQATTKLFNTQNVLKSNVVRQNSQQMLGAANSTQDIANKNYQKLSGGIGTNILAAKEGLKLIKQQVALLMKEGGTFNVIPSGALHAHKHNLPDEVADGLTKKGIPVIMEEGGEITQQAEIEREEIIFNLDLTKKLEELLKKFEDGDEEAAIEAGKLLTYEILENTVDNVGLINKIE